ncbi:MAG: redoxin family protein [Opitutae bacterium]|jgi:nucleoredoxin|nr:redoxin family protein [Opitutae bacterium]
MKTSLFLTSLALLFSSSLSAEMRTWTSSAGSKIEAELVEYSNRVVVLRSADGRRISLPINKLAPADQVMVTKWHAENSTSTGGFASASKQQAVKAQLKPGLAEMLPEQLLDSSGKKISRNELAGKTVGFYFSAHWCPPCRAFTPSLVKFRDSNKKDFEVVFVSSDKSPDAQMEYMKETNMKWYTLPHRSSEGNALSQKFGVRGIPALIIVSPDGETITKNGRGDVSSNASGAIKAWTKSS